MKSILLLVTVMMLIHSHGVAAENELAEIVQLLVSRQNSATSFEDGDRFDLLMYKLGAATAACSKEEIHKLNPARLEDRLRLIALHRFEHRELYDGIYHVYVRHPTEAELEKKRKEHVLLFPNGTGPNDSIFDGGKNGRSSLLTMDARVSAPDEIEAHHLTPPYRYCFEYFWMAPHHETTMKHCDGTMALALDHWKKHSKDADIRALIEAEQYAELEDHLQSLNVVGSSAARLQELLGRPSFEGSGAFGYSFPFGNNNACGYYLGHMKDGKVEFFKRIDQTEWRRLCDEPSAAHVYFKALEKKK